MTKNPFGFPENAVERFMREDAERTRMFAGITRPPGIVEAMKAAQEQLKFMQVLQVDEPFKAAREALRVHEEQRKAFGLLANAGWARSIQDTAQAMSRLDHDTFSQQRQLAGLISSGLADTFKTLDQNKTLIATALSARSTFDQYTRMATEMLPQITAFRSIAQQMQVLDMATLRASAEHLGTSAAAFVAEQMAEAERLAEAMGQAATVEDGHRLLVGMLAAVFAIFQKLGDNTTKELGSLGLLGIMGLLSAILSFAPLLSHDEIMPPQEQAAFVQLQDKASHLQSQVDQLMTMEAKRDEAFIADLPRAMLTRPATFRHEPKGDGAIVLKAPNGMLIAIAEARGRWRKVVFRDPLSNQLSSAWVYSSAIAPLASEAE